jgi:hypothetical protein
MGAPMLTPNQLSTHFACVHFTKLERRRRRKVEEDNLSFLRMDRAFERCMEIAHKKWRWIHKKLD